MQAPVVSYSFNLKDAHVFYCKHDHTMNFIMDDDSRLEINGIDERTMFTCVRNAIAAGDGIIKELEGKPYQLEAAQAMIDVLEGFIDAYKPNTEDDK